MESQMKAPIAGYLYALGALLIWSGFILVSRFGGLSTLTIWDSIAIRYFVCATLLLPVWLWKYPFKLFQPKLIISSIVGALLYAVFSFTGFKYTPASHAALLLPGFVPFAVFMLSTVISGERHSLVSWLGIMMVSLGIMGLLLFNTDANFAVGKGHYSIIVGAFCWASYTVLLKRWAISAWQATVSLAVITALIYLPIYALFLPKNILQTSITVIAIQAFYQGFLATIVQMMFYVRAVHLIGSTTMGSLMGMVPIIAGFSAIVVFNEALTQALVAGLLLVSTGVVLSNTKRRKKLLRPEDAATNAAHSDRLMQQTSDK